MSTTKCEICLTNEHKYKCPRCSMKTCSLVCCKAHKSNTGCTGERDKTKFIPKDEFDEQALLSDYKYLEEHTRLIDAFQRTIEQIDSNETDPFAVSKIAPLSAYENMRKFVKTLFNINLRIMPTKSTRHTSNKTRFNRAANLVSWSMEFVFHLDKTQIEASSSLKNSLFRFHTKNVLFSSSETIKNILKQMHAKFKNVLFENIYENDHTQSISSVCLIKTFASYLQNENFNDLHVLFEMCDFKLKKKYFVKFNLDTKLDECLRNKTLIEYPTLYLVTTNNLSQYFIQDQTDQNEKELNKQNEEENDEARMEGDTENGDDNDEAFVEDDVSEKSTSDSEELFHKSAHSPQSKMNPIGQFSNGDLVKKAKLAKCNEDYEIEDGEEVDSD
jgi:hypothetical protein